MKKSKLIKILGFLCLFLLVVILVTQLWVWRKGEISTKDITIKVNKEVYEYGEPVEIEVIRNFPSAENDKRYGKSFMDICGLVVSKGNDPSFTGLDCSNGNVCKYYCDRFRFVSERLKPEKIVWDQRACFGTSWQGKSVPPGDYVIGVSCGVTFTDDGWSHASITGNTVNIKIKEQFLKE